MAKAVKTSEKKGMFALDDRARWGGGGNASASEFVECAASHVVQRKIVVCGVHAVDQTVETISEIQWLMLQGILRLIMLPL